MIQHSHDESVGKYDLMNRINTKTLFPLKGEFGNSALHYAAKKGMIDVIDDLVEKMDDKNLQNFYGDTPLHVATSNNQIDVVKKLVKLPDVNVLQCNFQWQIPLYVAERLKHRKIEKILKQCRSNENEGSQSNAEFCCDMGMILI